MGESPVVGLAWLATSPYAVPNVRPIATGKRKTEIHQADQGGGGEEDAPTPGQSILKKNRYRGDRPKRQAQAGYPSTAGWTLHQVLGSGRAPTLNPK
jgi:hypothetical protein